MRQAKWCAVLALWALAACSGASERSVGEQAEPLTYWQDIAPLMAERCLQCHSEGGIAPLRLDDYARVEALAPLIEHVTRERTMPPWSATSDGTCGELSDSIALSDSEIERISDWVQAGALEGTPRAIDVPERPSLAEATDFVSPLFVPEIQGGELAAYDEYRCFELDAPAGPMQFITGYEVLPGSPEIVHHVIATLVDPSAPARVAEDPTRTNLEQMRALDAESPDRDGWPCFGGAGQGIRTEAEPVAWGPGQGIVRFPDDSGVALRPEHKVVIQIHYNLADPQYIGMEDQTTVRLQTAASVERIGRFVLPDPLLESLRAETPDTLPPAERSHVYSWTRSGKELGLASGEQVRLFGVAPHMHELGRKYRMMVSSGDDPPECAIDIQRWNFHWQRMYFYEQPWLLDADSSISVSCDYDTSSRSAPVSPGWGTRNEMCLAALYITQPLSDVE
jgi:Copper type II ascorbate-dependent monooxygenase, C-terminal domain